MAVHGSVRTLRFPDALAGLPVAVELVDDDARIEAFLQVVGELAPGAFAIREPVRLHRPPAPGKP